MAARDTNSHRGGVMPEGGAEERGEGDPGLFAGTMGKTILIVDGDEDERQIFSRFLRFLGGIVLEAGTGEEGLRAARDHLPDLALVDLALPVLDGWGTLRRLREDPLTGWIPVVALTAHPLERGLLERAGFCGCLEKPIVPVGVMREVERCIGRLHVDLIQAPSLAAS
jgi:two-component system cell cycle response regulator DivK